MNTVLFVIAAYLVGSVSFALVFSKIFGLADPRTYGSGNPGATNVLRSGNKLAALLTLLGDAAKGWFAVWMAFHFGPDFQLNETGIAMVCVAVFLGHLFPVFARFKGGKRCRDCIGCLAGNQSLAGSARSGDLAVCCGFDTLFVIVSPDCSDSRADLLRIALRIQSLFHGDCGHERFFDQSSLEKYRQSAFRKRKQNRQQEKSRLTGAIISLQKGRAGSA